MVLRFKEKQGLLHSKKPWFFSFPQAKRRKLPRFVLCFTVRFTAFHSAVRVSLHPTALRVFHFLFSVSWVGGAAIVLGKRRGVECALPPHAAVGQVPCFCDNEAFLAYSKSDHVSHLFVLGYDLHCALSLLFRLDSLLLLGRERRGFG